MLADWDDRLLSPERALRLAGDWPVHVTYEYANLAQFEPEGSSHHPLGKYQINLRCGKDSQSITLLADGMAPQITPYPATIGDLLSDVVRHLVTAHDLTLSGAPDG